MTRSSEIDTLLPTAERLFRSGQADTAERLLQQVVALDPSRSRAHELLAYIAGNRGDLAACENALRAACGLPQASAESFFYLARLLLATDRPAEAIGSLEQVIALKGRSFETVHELAVAHSRLGRHPEALDLFTEADRRRPGVVEVQLNLARTLEELRRQEEALARYDRALKLDPRQPLTWADRGNLLTQMGRHAEALASFAKGLQLGPETPDLRGNWVHAKLFVCDWRGLTEAFEDLCKRAGGGERVSRPFELLSTPASPAQLLAATRAYAQDLYPVPRPPVAFTLPDASERMRVGYFSADFHDHATSQLMVHLFECHDRAGFEWFGFSFGPQKHDPMRARVAASFDRFIDVSARSDAEIASLARESGLHIAVDLKGYTTEARPGIFTHRAAPVQASYLGFPGTMASASIDYLFADATLVRPEDRPHYTECVVNLPGSYQVNDSGRRIGAMHSSRADFGLPAQGFVFCCFNNNYKITPELFGAWMRLLSRVPGSVLWLLRSTEEGAARLRSEAEARGVAGQRIVFAGRLDLADHLARHAHADLFLDTLHYNAHTTCSDALWAGLPVLTLEGDTFAARVGASLLRAVGLTDMITTDLAGYEARAFELATSAPTLAAVKARLAAARLSATLFDTERFARRIESAYRVMVARLRAGLAPAPFDVEDR